VLEAEYPTHKTKENQNNLLGLSLSLLSMPRSARFAVLEMGMNHAREIAALTAIARPDVAVITNVGQAHIGHLGSREAIARAKLEILEGCEPGTPYFYPAEEPLLRPPCHAATVPYPIAARRGTDNAYFDVVSEEGYTRFSLDFRRWRYEGLRVRGRGTHMAACAAFAVCIGDLMGVSHEGIAQALLHYEENKMRGAIRDLYGVSVIEDCYNASPESMAAALAVLLQIAKEKGGRAFALLGGMRELGEHAPALHRALGGALAETDLAYLFPFGEGAREIAEGARMGGMEEARIVCNEDEGAPEESAKEIAARIRRGDVLLIKGSRATGCERVSDALSLLLQGKEGEI
jgi:UDP-N-acetylmuramoyl-tripeptide--D-alanyl-D-alanine ligase